MEQKETSNGIQILIIFLVCVLGEVLHEIIPAPISSGVYGMIIMLLLLIFKIVKVSQVERVGNFLVKNMMIMFLPISVGLIDMVSELKVMIIPVIISFSIVTFLVMLVTGKSVQLVIRKLNKGEKENA